MNGTIPQRTPMEHLRRLQPEIALGVIVLDEHYPGWRQLVDADVLLMERGDRCMLGQLAGDYLTGLNVVSRQDWPTDGTWAHARDEWALKRGFAARTLEDYARLDALWRRELREGTPA